MTRRSELGSSASVPTFLTLGGEALGLAEQVVAFEQPAGQGEPRAVVELRDVHGNLLARSVLPMRGDAEAAADELLRSVQLERCSEFIFDPLSRVKIRRSVAAVSPTVGGRSSRYEQVRASAPGMAV
ncbi:hypothetical protein [Arenivirga flava]|uniref:Uncharacterized protein n=1 Tax=Arenivirga flava TaxID=1930060 RepID=A0AA37UGR6_9MICO|nr:hypothetical protein [Arenivirga flava]GMA27162.1 hypothetical protein GCM10025874_04150 [Arenivirga flava]